MSILHKAVVTIEEAKRYLAEYAELLAAVRTLNTISPLGDHVYAVREREGLGWEGPKVCAWGEAASMVNVILARHPLAAARPSEGGE